MKQLIKLYKEVENKINTYDQLEYFKRCLKKILSSQSGTREWDRKKLTGDSVETKLRKQDFQTVIIRKTTTITIIDSFKKQVMILGKGTQNISQPWADCTILDKIEVYG